MQHPPGAPTQCPSRGTVLIHKYVSLCSHLIGGVVIWEMGKPFWQRSVDSATQGMRIEPGLYKGGEPGLAFV